MRLGAASELKRVVRDTIRGMRAAMQRSDPEGFKPIRANRFALLVSSLLGLAVFVAAFISMASVFVVTTNEMDRLKPAQRAAVMRILESDTSYTDNQGSRFYSELFLPLLIPVGLMVAASTAGVFWLMRPLSRISETAERVAGGNLKARVGLSANEEHSNAEVFVLARNFNTMAATLERDARERTAETAAIAHELRTPLTVMRGRLEGVRYGVFPLNDREIDLINGQIDLLTRLAEDLKILGMAGVGQLKLERHAANLSLLTKDVIEAFAPIARDKLQHLELHAPDTITLEVDAYRIQQVIGNLISNAIRHTPEGGRIGVSLSTAGPNVLLRVEDTGPGIPAFALEHLFERFYRADDSRSRHSGGSGLGLTIAKTIVELHGGGIFAANRSGGGAEFCVRLPFAPLSPALA